MVYPCFHGRWPLARHPLATGREPGQRGPGLLDRQLFLHFDDIADSLSVYVRAVPTRIRAFGCSAASAWLRLASAGGPGIVGFLLAEKGLPSIFLLFGSVAPLGAFVTWIGATETKGRLLEEISP